MGAVYALLGVSLACLSVRLVTAWATDKISYSSGRGFLISGLKSPLREFLKPAENLFHALYRLPWALGFMLVQLVLWAVDLAALMVVVVSVAAGYTAGVSACVLGLVGLVLPVSWDVIYRLAAFGIPYVLAFWVGSTGGSGEVEEQS